MKIQKKTRYIVILIVVIVLVATSLFVHTYKRAEYWENVAAERNLKNWYEISYMTSTPELRGINKDTLKENQLYIEGLILSNTADLMPLFSENSTYSNFLRLNYSPFVYQLVCDINNNVAEEKVSAGIDLFSEMNKDLGRLASEIINYVDGVDGRDKAKFELLDMNSKLYKEAENKIIDFCKKYGPKIYEYEHGSSAQSATKEG